jgi:N-carbamoylputrescine amidase
MNKEHKPFRIALVQAAMSEDPAANLAGAISRVEKAAAAGAQVICLPELFRSRYFCQREDASSFNLAEPVPGPTTELLGKVAARLEVAIVVPVFERRAPGLYHNSAVVIDADGKPAGVYRKMHIPDDPSYYEKFYFTPGDLGFRSFRTRYGNIGVLICWDQWYPEAARLTALQGADVIFYPTAIGWHPDEKAALGAAQLDAWRTVQRGHAIANGLYVASVNRVGLEKPAAGDPGLEFWGSSFVADPQGVVLAEASAEKEEILCATVDPARIEDIRRNWPFLRDRRIDAYGGITSRFLDTPANHANDANRILNHKGETDG